MFKNYFRVALRSLWRQKGFSLLNIIGLTVGMTSFFLIFLYVCFELSYDSMHSKADRIYRIVSDIKTPTETLHFPTPPVPASVYMAAEFPEVQSEVRLSLGDNWMVIRGDQVFEQNDVASSDSTFFDIFDFPLIKGNPKSALKEPFSVVLTETTAKKFFGSADPMGQSLTLTRDKFRGIVTGVMKDLPENSHLKIAMMISTTTFSMKMDTGMDRRWDMYGWNAYLLLRPQVSAARLESKFPAFLERLDGADMRRRQMVATLHLEPVRDVYLRSTRDGSKTGNIAEVYIFSIIGAFILIIAGINFINLTTARSAERAKEVGIRKVVGAGKGMLAAQFIGESIILCLIACLLAFVFAALLLPAFNQIAGKTVSLGIFSQPIYVLILLVISVVIGIAAGIYPALVLSSFKPVLVLKGRFVTGTRGIMLRKALVIVQFTIATGLIIGTLMINNQLKYMRSQDLGFNKSQEIVMDVRGDSARMAFKQEVSALPGVFSTAMSSNVPGMGTYNDNCQLENAKGDMQTGNIDMYAVDFDYLKQFKIKVIAGRDFSKEFRTDTTQALILNETAVRQLGYSSPSQAIGKKFAQFGNTGKIVGVVKDFHFRSLQEMVTPLCIRLMPLQCDLLCVNADGHQLPTIIAAIERKWKRTLPDKPFSYFFLDEFFDKQYRSEDRFGQLFLYFAGLAIFISCLGLTGLASYSTLQRTKEIGIRKVIGASASGITVLLSKDFLKLVGWAFLIAAPLTWFFINRWLQGFAYRMTVYWWIFGLAGLTSLLIALVTVSFHAIRAALANPVKSLKSE
jgi:putative ABC transport system permease protein